LELQRSLVCQRTIISPVGFREVSIKALFGADLTTLAVLARREPFAPAVGFSIIGRPFETWVADLAFLYRKR
jgi:hypothetical protein